MKHIFLNLKRFDVPKEFGGVNRVAPIRDWASYIIKGIDEELAKYDSSNVDFTIFWPELHLLDVARLLEGKKHINIGSQGVFHEDVAIGGNFGAFTTHKPAAAMQEVGCNYTIIGHCEERRFLETVIREAGGTDMNAVNRILNKEIQNAIQRGMKVLYCIGEKSEELEKWEEVLSGQLAVGLEGVDKSQVTIAYEPIWSIGPGKVPADKPYITKVARLIKEKTEGLDVVYGGGLKHENAAMLASIEEIDGGLIALTRFTGDIGFYPEEYLEIIKIYLEA